VARSRAGPKTGKAKIPKTIFSDRLLDHDSAQWNGVLLDAFASRVVAAAIISKWCGIPIIEAGFYNFNALGEMTSLTKPSNHTFLIRSSPATVQIPTTFSWTQDHACRPNEPLSDIKDGARRHRRIRGILLVPTRTNPFKHSKQV